MNARSRIAFSVRLVVAALGYALAVPSALAFDPKPASRTAREATAEDTQRQILPLLLATIPSAERASLGRIVFRTTEDENPYQSGITHRSSRSHEIYLSRGFISAVAGGSEAALITQRTQSSRELIGYSKYYISVLQARWAHYPAESRTREPLDFEQYLARLKKVDSGLLRSATEDPIKNLLTTQTLAWVIAHYVEHSRWLAQHRMIPGGVTVELERIFDRKASELAHRAGYSPMPVFTNALLFSALESPRHGGSALCRGIGIVSDGLQVVDKEPDSTAHSTSTSAAEDYLLAQRSELDRLRLATGCAISPAEPSN